MQYVEKTLFLSSLLYLLTGRDFSDVDIQHGREMKKARRKAVEEYVNKKIKITSDKQQELTEALEKYDGIDIDYELEKIMQEIQLTDSQIAARVNSSRKLMMSIVQYNTKLAECDVLLSRYDSLATQYKSDIKRLTFIVDGERIGHQNPENKICPFCEGTITVKKQKSYIESANAELKKILSQLQGLGSSVENVKSEKVELQNTVISLIIDQAMMDIEESNPSLKGALSTTDKDGNHVYAMFSTLGASKDKIKSLIDEVNKIDERRFQEEDLIGRVYEYFLQIYAASGTKEDGEFYTPASVVKLIAEMIEPYSGVVYENCTTSLIRIAAA